jgi:hypothetical protein
MAESQSVFRISPKKAVPSVAFWLRQYEFTLKLFVFTVDADVDVPVRPKSFAAFDAYGFVQQTFIFRDDWLEGSCLLRKTNSLCVTHVFACNASVYAFFRVCNNSFSVLKREDAVLAVLHTTRLSNFDAAVAFVVVDHRKP